MALKPISAAPSAVQRALRRCQTHPGNPHAFFVAPAHGGLGCFDSRGKRGLRLSGARTHARTHARGQRAWKVPFGSPGAVRGALVISRGCPIPTGVSETRPSLLRPKHTDARAFGRGPFEVEMAPTVACLRTFGTGHVLADTR